MSKLKNIITSKNTTFILLGLLLYMGLYFLDRLSFLIWPSQRGNWWGTSWLIIIAITIFLAKTLTLKRAFKVAAILGVLLIGFLIAIINSEMEHEYAMYEVCFPAIKASMGVNINEPFPEGPVDKDGWGKWWYQHSECEESILPFPWGKTPHFSENPPEFHPVSQ